MVGERMFAGCTGIFRTAVLESFTSSHTSGDVSHSGDFPGSEILHRSTGSQAAEQRVAHFPKTRFAWVREIEKFDRESLGSFHRACGPGPGSRA